LLEVRGIEVSYGEAEVLERVSLDVDSGEVVVVAGSNGAGKTTLLRTIVGLKTPKSGMVKFKDEIISTLPPHEIIERGISLVPEGRRLFPYMSVRDNLEMGCYRKVAEKKRKESLEFVFSIFPILKDRQKQMAETLSGGEQQMLAIGRALMSCPELLMLDEPSLGLAPIIVQKLFKIINEICEREISILLVEQNIKAALQLADRGYVLENGRIVLEGDSKSLLNNEHVKRAYLGI